MFKFSFLSFITFVVVFFPLFPDHAGLVLEYLLLMLVLFLLSGYCVVNKSVVSTWAIFICASFMILTLISILRSIEDAILRDFFELIKPLYFLIVFIFGSNLIKTNEDVEKVVNIILSAFMMMIAFGLLESRVPFINDISSLIYKGIRQPVQFKSVLSFISPYTFASVLILPVFYFLCKFIFDDKKAMSFLLLCVSFATLIAAQSKTVVLSFLLSFIIFIVVLLTRKWLPNRSKLLSLALILSSIFIVSVPFIIAYAENNLRYLYSGFFVVYNSLDSYNLYDVIYSTPSISNRYEQLLDVLAYQSEFPLLGAGIVKEKIYPESFYALYLLRYGIIGIGIHLFFVLYMFVSSMKVASFYSKNDISLMCFFISISAYSISLPFSYFSSAVNDQARSGYIFYLLLGLCFSTITFLKKSSR